MGCSKCKRPQTTSSGVKSVVNHQNGSHHANMRLWNDTCVDVEGSGRCDPFPVSGDRESAEVQAEARIWMVKLYVNQCFLCVGGADTGLQLDVYMCRAQPAANVPIARQADAHSPETTLTTEEGTQRLRRDVNSTQLEDSVAEASDAGYEALPEYEEPVGPVADSQHFFPSFAPIFPPLGHSRPFYQEPYNSRSAYKPQDSFGFGSGTFRDYSFPQATAESERSANVLGSGNFGVLRGGTYYAGENDDTLNDDIYNNYYHGNNGHGRPSYYPANPLPTYRQGADFFANFKDFADISTPTKSSYSEFFVVYVNPNSTTSKEHHSDSVRSGSAPKNIFEQLQILDAVDETETEAPQKKVSKAKLKLEKYNTHQQTKEVIKKQKTLSSPKELYEPLLALS